MLACRPTGSARNKALRHGPQRDQARPIGKGIAKSTKLSGAARSDQVAQLKEALDFMDERNMTIDDCITVTKMTADTTGATATGTTGGASPRWPAVNFRLLKRNFAKRRDLADTRAILTPTEETDLAKIILAKHDTQEGLDRGELRTIVATMLKLRRRQLNPNRPTYRKGTQPLSKKALAVLDSGEALPSHKWFRKFYRRHPVLNEGGAVTDDTERVEAITAETASKHIKMLADSAILMPFSITASIELEDAIATLEGLQLKDEDVIKEAKDHIIIKPVLQTDSYPLLGPAFSEISETAFLDNPIWLHHIWLGSDVGGMFISGTEGISPVVNKIKEMIGNVDCDVNTIAITFNRRCN